MFFGFGLGHGLFCSLDGQWGDNVQVCCGGSVPHGVSVWPVSGLHAFCRLAWHDIFQKLPRSLRTQILLSVATSIDALAVGISFACLGYSCVSQLAVPLAIIGFVSFVMAVLGNALGARFGCMVAKRLKPDVVGGVILLAIGVKILVTHLWVQQ